MDEPERERILKALDEDIDENVWGGIYMLKNVVIYEC